MAVLFIWFGYLLVFV